MKKQILSGVMLAGWLLSAQASITTIGDVNGNSGTPLGLAIPDGNPVGVTSSLTVTDPSTSLSSLTVTLNISGGYNGDLYAYLSYNGTSVVLLNQVGTGGPGTFGFSTSGFNNVTLDDASLNGSIHDVANPGTGVSYTPDGGSLGTFANLDPNGVWTLYFADLSGGGGTSVLNGWSLNITSVPEPTNVALGVFAGLLVVTAVVRSRRVKQLWSGMRKA